MLPSTCICSGLHGLKQWIILWVEGHREGAVDNSASNVRPKIYRAEPDLGLRYK